MENTGSPQPLVTLQDITVTLGGQPILQHISLTIGRHEQWAIVGLSGSGKTTLAAVFAGSLFYRGSLDWHFGETGNEHIELVAQQHHFKNLSNTSSFYYQQRFNASEAEDSITVAEALGPGADQNNWISVLHLQPLLQEPLLQLSNGENKRLQLAKALLQEPAVLILDNPFIGLDVEGRQTLQHVLDNICAKGIHIILITSPGELPPCISHVAVLEQGRLASTQKKEDYLQRTLPAAAVPVLNRDLLHRLHQPAGNDFEFAVKMDGVTIRYGEKTILDNVSWQVKRGEGWNVSGPNGAGKSTLLSLVTADNPQAYANRIILFDKPRGSGESIWDIKRKIGFVSPELHLYFEQHVTCFEVIASGLFDTIGLFRALSAEQEDTIVLWMRLMELEAYRHKRIYQLSSSQQRMVLLARALVKNPPLLILDEPTQGLDDAQNQYFKHMVDEICHFFSTTLIYVSHYTHHLPACINHYLRLENGRVKR